MKPPSTTKDYIINNILLLISQNKWTVEDVNLQKPWGAYIRLADENAEEFINTYFTDIKEQFKIFKGLSPKYLIVAPGQQLSWQYHYRRAEHWKVLQGEVGVKLSDTDELPEAKSLLREGELVQFPAEKRHRLIGLDDWGIVVEIWEHVSDTPSDEADIVRVEDNYGR